MPLSDRSARLPSRVEFFFILSKLSSRRGRRPVERSIAVLTHFFGNGGLVLFSGPVGSPLFFILFSPLSGVRETQLV